MQISKCKAATARLQPEIYEALRKLAEKNYRSMQQEMTMAVMTHLKKEGAIKHGK